MRARSIGFGLVLAASLWLLPVGLSAQTPAASPHPDVDASQQCDACHQEATPAIVKDWSGSKHGQGSVKCFVCHGTLGSGFIRKPTAARCEACHGEQVDSLQTPFLKGKTCFDCHQQHALKAHRAPAQGGQR